MVTIHRERGFDVVVYPGDREHTPPHVHIFYGDEEVKIALGDEDTAPWVWQVIEMRKPNVSRALGMSRTIRKRSWRTGESTMARKWIPASQNAGEFERQFAAAVEAGRVASETEPRAEAARYHAGSGRVEVELRDGLSFAFPITRYSELATLPSERISEVRVTPSGYGLHWDEFDVHLAVPQVVADLFGAWGAQTTGREGGKSRSPAKREAARKNASRGGRPATRKETRREFEMLHVEAHAGRISRTVDVYVGSEYVVEPMNPAARKNRGRTGQVVAVGDDRYGRVQFRFSDTGRVGLVNASDLLPVEQRSAAA